MIPYLVNAVTFTDHWLQVLYRKPFLLHFEFNGFDRVRKIQRIVLTLIGLEKCDQYMQLFALRCIGLCHHQAFNPPQRRAVVGISSVRFDIHCVYLSPLLSGNNFLCIDLIVLGVGA